MLVFTGIEIKLIFIHNDTFGLIWLTDWLDMENVKKKEVKVEGNIKDYLSKPTTKKTV